MTHNILLTGASGYLGGTVLAEWKAASLPPYSTLYTLVRKPSDGEKVRSYGAVPLSFATNDSAAVRTAILEHEIDIVFHLINAADRVGTVNFITALSELKDKTGREVHFLFTSGAKIFSGLAGAPTDTDLLDTSPDLYSIQHAQKAPHKALQGAVDANNLVIDTAEAKGVRSYIFAPCIVYGKSTGFGNPISIQTKAIVQAAKGVGKVYNVNHGRPGPTWPVCHVEDTALLYLQILRKILSDEALNYGRKGYFLASTGSIAWEDLYRAMATTLFNMGTVSTADVEMADDEALVKMGEALNCSKEFVEVQLGGKCTFTARHGKLIGWKPRYPDPKHILQEADAEVRLILENI